MPRSTGGAAGSPTTLRMSPLLPEQNVRPIHVLSVVSSEGDVMLSHFFKNKEKGH